jgi:hypothetical protein
VNWFREDPLVGTVTIASAAVALAALWFLWTAHSNWSDAAARYATDAAEFDRLQKLTPYPSGPNLRNMQAYAEAYAASVAKIRDELKARVLPLAPVAPSEFQSRLRVTSYGVTEKARAVKVKLPDRFFLGFESFASALPDTAAAPKLAQELAQVEALINMMIDAHVDAVTSVRRIESTAGQSATPAPTKAPAAGAAPNPATLIERRVVDISFRSTPAASRNVLNAIATAGEQFYILRLVHVRNEKEQGPPRKEVTDAGGTPTAGAKPPAGQALSFIAGTEHIETTARVELVRFTF